MFDIRHKNWSDKSETSQVHVYQNECVAKKNTFFPSVVLSMDKWDGGGGPLGEEGGRPRAWEWSWLLLGASRCPGSSQPWKNPEVSDSILWSSWLSKRLHFKGWKHPVWVFSRHRLSGTLPVLGSEAIAIPVTQGWLWELNNTWSRLVEELRGTSQ